MVQDQKIQQLEGDVRLLKNEIKHVLTDIQEYVLNARNPFNAAMELEAVKAPNVEVVFSQPGEPRERSAMPQKGDARAEEDERVNGRATSGLVGESSEGSAPPEDPPSMTGSPPQSAVGGDPGGGLIQHTADVSPQVGLERPIASVEATSPVETDPTDLATVIALSAWVRSAAAKTGVKRTKTILEICGSAGYITPESREVLRGLTELVSTRKGGPQPSADMRTCMVFLAQLCNILNPEGRQDDRLLSLIIGLSEE